MLPRRGRKLIEMAEADEIRAIEAERARRRMLAGRPVEPSGQMSLGSKGQTRDKVARAVGLGSGKTWERAERVWRAAKDGDEVARRLVALLDI